MLHTGHEPVSADDPHLPDDESLINGDLLISKPPAEGIWRRPAYRPIRPLETCER